MRFLRRPTVQFLLVWLIVSACALPAGLSLFRSEFDTRVGFVFAICALSLLPAILCYCLWRVISDEVLKRGGDLDFGDRVAWRRRLGWAVLILGMLIAHGSLTAMHSKRQQSRPTLTYENVTSEENVGEVQVRVWIFGIAGLWMIGAGVKQLQKVAVMESQHRKSVGDLAER